MTEKGYGASSFNYLGYDCEPFRAFTARAFTALLHPLIPTYRNSRKYRYRENEVPLCFCHRPASHLAYDMLHSPGGTT